ncbi:MAG: 8-oxo-dGTP diphosphatase MutT [Clostridiales bacterium]|nr:8-oxo-dGTP diphosphatase MutT [Clostridiales bacterium]
MIPVVAALIVRDGRLLIARRPEGKHMAGRWEFPGGKLEKGESPEEAIEREIREELAAEIRAGRVYQAIAYSYPEKDVLLLFYAASVVSGEPRPVEEAEIRWITLEELDEYTFAPVDAMLVERLKRDGLGALMTIQA